MIRCNRTYERESSEVIVRLLCLRRGTLAPWESSVKKDELRGDRPRGRVEHLRDLKRKSFDERDFEDVRGE